MIPSYRIEFFEKKWASLTKRLVLTRLSSAAVNRENPSTILIVFFMLTLPRWIVIIPEQIRLIVRFNL